MWEKNLFKRCKSWQQTTVAWLLPDTNRIRSTSQIAPALKRNQDGIFIMEKLQNVAKSKMQDVAKLRHKGIYEFQIQASRAQGVAPPLSANTGNYHGYRSIPNTYLVSVVCYRSMGGQRVNKRSETIPSEPTKGRECYVMLLAWASTLEHCTH